MNMVLFGCTGSGKTTIGEKLAQKLGKAFIDTDHLIEETYELNWAKQLTTRQIYQEVGPITFRTLEYEVVQSLQDIQNSIIAVGGGTMLLDKNVETLQKNSLLIYLYFDKEALKKRVLAQNPVPAFLDPNTPEASFDKRYAEREECYKKIHAIEINVTTMKDKEIIDNICKSMKNGKQ